MKVHPQVDAFQAGQVVTVAGDDFVILRVRRDHLIVLTPGDAQIRVFTDTVEAVRPGGKEALARVGAALKVR